MVTETDRNGRAQRGIRQKKTPEGEAELMLFAQLVETEADRDKLTWIYENDLDAMLYTARKYVGAYQAEADASEMDAQMDALGAQAYPEKYKKEERRKYQKVCGRAPHSHTALKRVASVVLVIGLVFAVVLLSAPTIRADFFNLTTRFFDKYFSISTDPQESEYETPEFLIEYMPKDLVDVEVKENPVVSKYIFSSRDGARSVTLTFQPVKNSLLQFDNEHTTFKEVIINGYNGYHVTSELTDLGDIVWSDDTTLFSVMGNVSADELMRIAAGIERYENWNDRKKDETTYAGKYYRIHNIPKDLGKRIAEEPADAASFSFIAATSGDDRYVKIHSIPTQDGDPLYDSEHATAEDITINGYAGYRVTSSEDDCTSLIWSDGKNTFFVTGNLSEEELWKIAEGIEYADTE